MSTHPKITNIDRTPIADAFYELLRKPAEQRPPLDCEYMASLCLAANDWSSWMHIVGGTAYAEKHPESFKVMVAEAVGAAVGGTTCDGDKILLRPSEDEEGNGTLKYKLRYLGFKYEHWTPFFESQRAALAWAAALRVWPGVWCNDGSVEYPGLDLEGNIALARKFLRGHVPEHLWGEFQLGGVEQ